MKKRIIVLWKGGMWEYREIETETGLHDDRPNKTFLALKDVITAYPFTLSGECGGHWVYTQD